MQDEPIFGTVGDAAEIIGTSNWTIRRLIDRGELKAWKLPSGHRRVDLGACRALRTRLRGEEPVASTA